MISNRILTLDRKFIMHKAFSLLCYKCLMCMILISKRRLNRIIFTNLTVICVAALPALSLSLPYCLHAPLLRFNYLIRNISYTFILTLLHNDLLLIRCLHVKNNDYQIIRQISFRFFGIVKIIYIMMLLLHSRHFYTHCILIELYLILPIPINNNRFAIYLSCSGPLRYSCVNHFFVKPVYVRKLLSTKLIVSTTLHLKCL